MSEFGSLADLSRDLRLKERNLVCYVLKSAPARATQAADPHPQLPLTRVPSLF